jgi:hypothetical protein
MLEGMREEHKKKYEEEKNRRVEKSVTTLETELKELKARNELQALQIAEYGVEIQKLKEQYNQLTMEYSSMYALLMRLQRKHR